MVTLSNQGMSLIDSQSSQVSVSSFDLDINDNSQNYTFVYVYAAGACQHSGAKPRGEIRDASGNSFTSSYSIHDSGTSTHNYSSSATVFPLLRAASGTYDWNTFITIKMGYWRTLNGSVLEDIHLAAHTLSRFASGGSAAFSVTNAYFPYDGDNPKVLRFSGSTNSIYINRAAAWGMMGK